MDFNSSTSNSNGVCNFYLAPHKSRESFSLRSNDIFINFLFLKKSNSQRSSGIKKNNSEKFEEAIPDFEKGYAFFKKYEWIDKYRFITLLSASKMSYREMAIANIGFCYFQIGDGTKSKDYYERKLKEFPESGLAKSALKMISAIEKKAQY